VPVDASTWKNSVPFSVVVQYQTSIVAYHVAGAAKCITSRFLL